MLLAIKFDCAVKLGRSSHGKVRKELSYGEGSSGKLK